jgi:uncharacterized protein (TIGR04255 family)
MPSSLSVDDFKPFSTTCELRYKNAYLLYDRTGIILEDLRESFTDINVTVASPAQTAFTAEEGSFGLELGAARFTSLRLDKSGETFAKHCKAYFDTVAEHMRVTVFTRIGLRYILRREFKTEADSKSALASMMLANLKPARRFNSSDSPTEVLFRWEDEQIGAFVRLRAESADIKLAVPPELQDSVPKVDKKLIGLTVDVDYYTVAPVECEQWNALEWLPLKLRIIRKELDGIIASGAT